MERAEVKQSLDLVEMLEHSLAMERKHVELYTEALDLLGPRDVALRNLLEEICMEEQKGVDHLEKILQKKDLVAGGQARSQKVG